MRNKHAKLPAWPRWLKSLGRDRNPDFVIGDRDNRRYLARWYVIPRNPLFTIYVHKIAKSDDALWARPRCPQSADNRVGKTR